MVHGAWRIGKHSRQPFDRLRTSRQQIFIIICQLHAGAVAWGIEGRAWGTELLISSFWFDS